MDIVRQAYNNGPDLKQHRAFIQFFKPLPDGMKREGDDRIPVYEIELKPVVLGPHGVDNFNVATRERFNVPPGKWLMVAVTAIPVPKPVTRLRFFEKNPPKDDTFWMIGHAVYTKIEIR